MNRTGFSYDFPHASLVSIGDLNPLDVRMIFERARVHFDNNRAGVRAERTLDGATLINLFFRKLHPHAGEL